MMTRTNDAAFLNAIANHPSVRPWLGLDMRPGLGLDSEIDLGPLLAIPGNFALVNEHGGVIFAHEGEGVYELHTMFRPEGRGRAALTAALECERILFETCGATLLKTYVPYPNKAALGLIRFIGFRQTGADEENTYWAMDAKAYKARNPIAQA